MTNFDEAIRDQLNPGTSNANWNNLADALRAVLDLDHFNGTTQWQRGWNEALNAVRNAIAEELDVTNRAEAEGKHGPMWGDGRGAYLADQLAAKLREDDPLLRNEPSAMDPDGVTAQPMDGRAEP